MSVTEQDVLRLVKLAKKWVKSTTGQFSAFVFGKELGIENTEFRDRLLSDFRDDRLIEPVGMKNGFYRLVNKRPEPMNWIEASTSPYPIWLPLNLHRMAEFSPQNVICIQGESNSGKTDLGMRIAFHNLRQNGGCHDSIEYFTCELSPKEVRKRTAFMGQPDKWQGFNVYPWYENYHDVIDPDGFNVIDYLEVIGDFWNMGRFIDLIHQRLRNGIAIVLTQKGKNSEYGVGGQFSNHRARLTITVGYSKETHLRTATIVKCKDPIDDRSHPDGMQLDYRFNRGHLEIVHPWAHITEEQRKARDKVASQRVREIEAYNNSQLANQELRI